MTQPTLHSQQIQAPSTDQFDRLSPEQRRFQLRLDLARRAGQGESIRVECYLEMYPSLREDTDLLVDLLTSEVSLRTGQGESVPLAELQERFPQLADSVSRLMAPASVTSEAGTLPPPGPSEAGILPPAGGSEASTLAPVSANSEDATIAPAAGPSHGPFSSVQKEIANYEVLGELGRGGMGVVYKARQKGLNRLVALKMILHADHAGSDERMRFEREAQAIARLEHPHIVQVYEIGEHEGKPYFSLEYVTGGALDKKLDRKPMDAIQAAELIETLARGMAAAHRADVIHRDLKPANVLLTEDGVPKITDFGLAKNLDEAGQTQSGAIMGTPSYMAPEQAAGKSQAMGPGVDIYALGAILYECLTGRPPFQAATAMDTVLQVISQPASPPSQLRADIPMDLETICLKCLEKEPNKRYETTELLAEDLRRFRDGEPISARPVGRAEKLWRWCRRSPAVASLLLLVMVLLLAGSGVSTWFAIEASNRAESEKKLKERAIESALRNAEREMKLAESEKKAREATETALAKTKFVNYAFRIDQARQAARKGDYVRAREILGFTEPTLRRWGHDFIYRQTMPKVLMRHPYPVNSVAFSPDGKQIVSGNYTELKVWDAVTGEEALTLKGHTYPVYSVAFSPEGKRIVSGGGNVYSGDPGEVKVWDATTGEEVLTLKGHPETVESVAFSPDGKWIVSGGSGYDKKYFGEWKVWDAVTGEEALTLKGHTYPVYSAAFSPDGKRIVSGGGGVRGGIPGEGKVWDATTGEEALTLKGHASTVSSVAYSPDGKRIVSGSWDGTVKVWDATTGEQALTLKGHTDRVLSVAFSPDGKRIVSGSGDLLRRNPGEVKVWDAATGEEALTLKGHTLGVYSVAFSPDGKRIVSGSGDRTVKVWDAKTEEEALTLEGHTSPVNSAAFSPDGKRIVSGGSGGFRKPGELKVWDAATGEEALTLKGHTSYVLSVAFSPDGKRIVSGGSEYDMKTKKRFGEVKVWDATTGEQALTLKGHTNVVTSVALSPDGKRIVSGGSGGFRKPGELKVWDAATGEEALTLKGHTSYVLSVAFSPDGTRIVSGSGDRTVKVWDAVTGEQALSLKGHTSPVNSVAFSPDGKRIVSGSEDKTVKVWDVTVQLWDETTGQEAITLKGHTGSVRSVAFSPDGKRILSGSSDSTVKVWDAATGQEAITLDGHTSSVTTVAFSSDGKRIISGSGDKTIKVWDAATVPILKKR